MNDKQSILLQMAKDIASVFNGYDIPFYLVYGSMLGAVRDKGMIPWDDDMDLGVLRKDLPRIREALESKLDPEKYYVHFPRCDTHPHVIYKGDDIEFSLEHKDVPFIDLFVIEKYPEGRIRRLFTGFFIQTGSVLIEAADRVPALYSILRRLYRVSEKTAIALSEDDTKYSVIYSTTYKNTIFPADYYAEGTLLDFEDASFPVPKEYEKMLTSIYGDYMVPPPEDQRSGASGFPCSIIKDRSLDMKGRNRS